MVFPCVFFPSCWQLFLCVCQPRGGPVSAQHSRAENTGLHPPDSMKLVSDTTSKLASRLFPPTEGFYYLGKHNSLKHSFLKYRGNVQTWTKVNNVNYKQRKLPNSQSRDLPTPATEVKLSLTVNWDYLILDAEITYIFQYKYLFII